MYSSRTRYNTDLYRRIHAWKTRLKQALAKIPAELLSEEERRLREELSDLPDIAILQLIYQQKSYEGPLPKRTTNSPAPRCANTGRADMRIRRGR